jgi:hypothetical protein
VYVSTLVPKLIGIVNPNIVLIFFQKLKKLHFNGWYDHSIVSFWCH